MSWAIASALPTAIKATPAPPSDRLVQLSCLLEAMMDEDIDYSDIPPLTDEFFENAMLRVQATQADNLIQLES